MPRASCLGAMFAPEEPDDFLDRRLLLPFPLNGNEDSVVAGHGAHNLGKRSPVDRKRYRLCATDSSLDDKNCIARGSNVRDLTLPSVCLSRPWKIIIAIQLEDAELTEIPRDQGLVDHKPRSPQSARKLELVGDAISSDYLHQCLLTLRLLHKHVEQ